MGIFCSCKILKTTPKIITSRAYKVFFYEGKKYSRFSANLKIDEQENIFFCVKKMGVIVYKKNLKKKKYHSSDVFKFSQIAHRQLIDFLINDHTYMQLFIGAYHVNIDNGEKTIIINAN